ncbi:proton-coupled zinc antiporter SLC30A2-like [Antedon mediterranea]|uniref:proton-coupled zinc antiporter SLC30A2-like n=1 Tax=Antedon mediterranea TaxID=105859 RepID=UPI003AF741DC
MPTRTPIMIIKQEDQNGYTTYGATENGHVRYEAGENGNNGLKRELSAHCHSNMTAGRDHAVQRRTVRRKLIYASVVCLSFIVIEIIGGLLAGSLSILTDAAHLFSDFASFVISYFALVVAEKGPTRRLTWGWHRAEVLGAFLSVLMMWSITAILVTLAVIKIMKNNYEINATIMMITAAFAIFVNVIMLVVLHNQCKGRHAHGGSHGHIHLHNLNSESDDTANRGNETSNNNVNIRAAILHVVGDFIQSIAVFIAALIIYIQPKYKIADPICTFIFSGLVLATTIQISKEIINVLMEAKPDAINFGEVSNSILELKGVTSLHDLRIWMITTDHVVCSVHLTVDSNEDINQETLLSDIRRILRVKFNISDSTIQIEKHRRSMINCELCTLPADK